MNLNDINKKYNSVCISISNRKVKKAFDILKELVEQSQPGIFHNRLQELETTYENMLRYTIEGVSDPEREKVYKNLLRSILELADQTLERILVMNSGWNCCSLKQELEKEQKLTGKTVVEKIEDLSFKNQLDEVLNEINVNKGPRQSFESQKHNQLISRIFTHLLLTDEYKEAEKSLIDTLLDENRFKWYERSIFVSSVSLSLFRYFDIQKFTSLFRIYRLKEEEVWQRAFIGLVLAFYKYNSRIDLYPGLSEIMDHLEQEESIEKELEQVLIQLIRSGDTESISKKIRDEIVPEMVKLAPRLTEKLDLDKLLPEDFAEEKNPDWEKIFKESEGLYEKIEEFSKLQLEGADVFMSAFSQLKQFSFFSDISNWFLPFIADNPLIDDAFRFDDAEFDKELFLSGLETTAYMCNSDKYSFCLNIKLMPEAQRSMLLKMFQAELDGMKEIKKQDEIIDEAGIKKSKTIYTQYIHDLYRFVKLFRFKNEYYDPFKSELDFYNSLLFKKLVSDDTLLENIAEYYFQNEHYIRAIDIFTRLEGYDEKADIIEKIAYSYQMTGDYDKALEYYRKAEIFNANKEWLLKKIGLCYRKLNNSPKALKYYKRAESIDPDNLYTQASIGHCLLDLKEYDKALKYYFKVEYLDPKNTKVWRPLAWCCFVEGKFKQADKYYRKIESGNPTYHDLMSMGHLELCKGNKNKATELYIASINSKGNKLEKFLESFEQDKIHLIKHGISPDDLPILLDHIQYRLLTNQGIKESGGGA